MNYLIGWNDEVLSMRLIEGPFADNRVKEAIHDEVINMLRKTYKMDTGIAETVYQTRIHDLPCNINEYGSICLDIWETGASLQYGGGYEDRIKIVTHTGKVHRCGGNAIAISEEYEEEFSMGIGWISADMKGNTVNPSHEEDIVLLPVEGKQITEYLRRHPDAEIFDLYDNGKCFPSVMHLYKVSILDFISKDCTLEELNQFLWTASQMTKEQFEVGMCRLLEVKQQRTGGTLNTADMLDQVMRWEEMRYYPISAELFINAASIMLPGSTQKALETWMAFAKGCVEQEQYVDFEPVTDKDMAVDRWLETLLAGFYKCKVQYGEDAAAQLCNLGEKENPMCLYPGEMEQAVDYLINGGSADKLAEMIQSDVIEAIPPFFPKIKDYDKLSEFIDRIKKH